MYNKNYTPRKFKTINNLGSREYIIWGTLWIVSRNRKMKVQHVEWEHLTNDDVAGWF